MSATRRCSSKAKDLDLSGLETPEQINANPELLRRFELIRTYAAVAMGLAETAATSQRRTPGHPENQFRRQTGRLQQQRR